MLVPSWAYRRPDPLIYSQAYLQKLGFAVTWDNPDITVERGGVPVNPHELEPDTSYEVIARIWNGSTSGPAADLPVSVSYLDFGIGTVAVPVGATAVDLPVKGASGCPAFARVPWTTPATPGHYCLQVSLQWPDDAEPGNNLGQSNTDVRPLNSPRATSSFALRNDAGHERRLRLTADAYVIPEPLPCDERPRGEQIRHRHDPAAHPVPDDWSVEINPQEADLGPGESVEVGVVVEAPAGFSGRKTFNVNAWAGEELVGGVTLTTAGTA